ncbi:unnamed protein product [Ilex paraguariensis]|uniref:Uncharacterized protein n=1 Tax=Ilex paraguariensis TaxID=185542 RepID=A0ABC8SGY7_9AQUA
MLEINLPVVAIGLAIVASPVAHLNIGIDESSLYAHAVFLNICSALRLQAQHIKPKAIERLKGKEFLRALKVEERHELMPKQVFVHGVISVLLECWGLNGFPAGSSWPFRWRLSWFSAGFLVLLFANQLLGVSAGFLLFTPLFTWILNWFSAGGHAFGVIQLVAFNGAGSTWCSWAVTDHATWAISAVVPAWVSWQHLFAVAVVFQLFAFCFGLVSLFTCTVSCCFSSLAVSQLASALFTFLGHFLLVQFWDVMHCSSEQWLLHSWSLSAALASFLLDSAAGLQLVFSLFFSWFSAGFQLVFKAFCAPQLVHDFWESMLWQMWVPIVFAGHLLPYAECFLFFILKD